MIRRFFLTQAIKLDRLIDSQHSRKLAEIIWNDIQKFSNSNKEGVLSANVKRGRDTLENEHETSGIKNHRKKEGLHLKLIYK